MAQYKLGFEDIWHRIIVAKESVRYDAYSKHITVDFEDAANINVDSSSVITQGGEVRMIKIVR